MVNFFSSSYIKNTKKRKKKKTVFDAKNNETQEINYKKKLKMPYFLYFFLKKIE
jgi:hypothetical protein